jgi:hypothetical protein
LAFDRKYNQEALVQGQEMSPFFKDGDFNSAGEVSTAFHTIFVCLCGIFSVLIGLRPGSEILWQNEFLGKNCQSHLTIFLFFIACFLTIMNRTVQRHFLPLIVATIFYSSYIALFSILNGNLAFLEETLKTVTSLIVGLTVFSTLNRGNLKTLFVFLTFSVLCLTVVSYMQHFGIYDFYYFSGSVIKGQSVGRVSGGLSHPNDLNRTLVFFLFILFFFFKKNNTILRLTMFFALAYTIFLTFHRTTYLCVVMILMLYFIECRKYLYLVMFSGLVAVAITLNFDWLWYFIIEQRLNFADGFEGSRFWYSYESMRLFCEAPFYKKFFGSGLFPGGRIHGDGDFPRILYAYGIVGFLGYAGVVATIFHSILRKIDRDNMFSALCLFGIWVVFSIFTDVTRYPAFLIMLFVCLRGVALRFPENAKNA